MSRHRYIPVTTTGQQGPEYQRYSQACSWLDDNQPEGAVAGFTCEYTKTPRQDGTKAVMVRHS